MIVREVRIDEKDRYNTLVSHPVQSWEWGEFKRKTGIEVSRLGIFDHQAMLSAHQLTFHPVPHTPYTVGYSPKDQLPDTQVIEAFRKLGVERNALFIKLEPNALKQDGTDVVASLSKNFDLRPGRSIFTPYTFIIDLSPSEEELLAAMKSKTRYNVGLAKRRGVVVSEDNSDAAFEAYLRLTFKTAQRQGFYAHDENYHRKMWEILHTSMKRSGQAPIARLLTATWKETILVAWIVFLFSDILYYPYGASSSEHRDLMASNLVMWEAMRFGKRMNCRRFDLWGSLGPDPDPRDPWYGFHRFKSGYGGRLVEFVGTYDLVVLPQLYPVFRAADDLRWKWLRFMTRFR